MRQRTLPEQKELLRGLGQARPAAEPPRPRARVVPAGGAKLAPTAKPAPMTGDATGAAMKAAPAKTAPAKTGAKEGP